MSKPIRLVLIDDHGLCRHGLAELLEHKAGMHVLGATGDPDEAERILKQQQPDLLIMDLRMPQIDGLDLLERLRAAGCAPPTIILTMSDSEQDLSRALRAEVRGYLLKDMDPDAVINSIHRAALGELVIAPAMTGKLAKLLEPPSIPARPREGRAKLTDREREILHHLACGKSNKAIARALAISHDTVKLHVRHILSKLNMTSRVEAAVFAIEHGAEYGIEPPPKNTQPDFPT
ncbi:MAG: response regulator transcription factor [Sterolibacterium sp.]|jgi:two-component system nitrate/nitrite response regulator NarL